MTWVTQLFDALVKPFRWWVVVAPWERGIRVRTGKSVKQLDPGIHLRIPLLDRIYVQTVRIRMISAQGQTIATSDGLVLTLSVAIQYAICDIVRVYNSVANLEDTLLNVIEGLIAEIVATAQADALSPKVIEEQVTARMPSMNWGLSDVKCRVTSYAFVRTYRLIQASYKTLTGSDNLDREHGHH